MDAAEVLLPALLPLQTGPIIYVDGHMIAYWSRMPMHKGKIPMLGRIMAGSQAVIAYDDAGQASLWHIIRPTSMCLRSLWHTASGWHTGL